PGHLPRGRDGAGRARRAGRAQRRPAAAPARGRRHLRAAGLATLARVSTIRLVVVDDDDLVRTGLRLILGGAPDLEVVAEAADGRQAVEAVRRTSPDVVLMDIRMPVLDGLAATQQVLALPKPPQVIILTTVDTDEMVLEALRLGACGFLLKSTRPD